MTLHDRYRAFRIRALKETKKDVTTLNGSHYDCNEALHPHQILRKKIQLIRAWVQDNAPELIEESESYDPLIRRTLHIPETIPLLAARWSLARRIGQNFIPMRLIWPRVQAELSAVRTFEGREYLYEQIYKRELGFDSWLRNIYFSPELDAALRWLKTPSQKEVSELKSLDPDWTYIMHKFGLHRVTEISPYARYGISKLRGDFAAVMVQEKIVNSLEEIRWLDYQLPHNYNVTENSRQNRFRLRSMLHCMMAYDISREQIAGILRYPVRQYDHHRLQANLNVLTQAGVKNLTDFLKSTGDLLWRAPTGNWHYLLHEVGIRSSSEMARFKQLLQSDTPLSVPLIRLLKKLATKTGDLVHCQSLIILLSDVNKKSVPLKEIEILTSAPHFLSLKQIALCHDYLDKFESIQDFLNVLIRYDYGDAAAVIAFQGCFKSTSASTLDRWLNILSYCNKRPELKTVVPWVQASVKSGHDDACLYLIKSIGITAFNQLLQVEPVLNFSRSILTFLVETKGHSSAKALNNWYYSARGVHSLQRIGKINATLLILLEDACKRNNFVFVNSNYACIESVIDKQVYNQSGPRPFKSDKETREHYDQSYSALAIAAREKILPQLPAILEQTNGVLLKSILQMVWEPAQSLQARLLLLKPALDELLAGRGPSSESLSETETEVICLLYRTTSEVVSSTWHEICGRQSDLSKFLLRDHYPVTWNRVAKRFTGELEKNSLSALKQAREHASRFLRYPEEEVFNLCKQLRAGRLTHRARDPWTLSAHLGILFAAAGTNSPVAGWLNQELDRVVEITDQSFDIPERLTQLDKLFSVTLPDALDENAQVFIQRFSKKDATFLAERMVGKEAVSAASDAHTCLMSAIMQTRKTVLREYLRWISRERGKFQKVTANKNSSSMRAILTKYPAAFFARQAAQLCTSNNTSMWNESRHAHLIVTDAEQGVLAGMAMIYIEPVKAVHADKPCLIIRAISPMDEMLATHNVSSIVESFFDTAIQIAKDNALAAVLFPANGGMHVLSNQRDVEKDIEKRYVSRAISPRYEEKRDEMLTREWRQKPRLFNAEFYAYEHGVELVNRLYAFWVNEKTVDEGCTIRVAD